MPKIKCPDCGSTNTARLTSGDYYYIAEHNERLKEDVDAGKVVLSGCEPSVNNRFCHNCELEFDTPALARYKQEGGVLFS